MKSTSKPIHWASFVALAASVLIGVSACGGSSSGADAGTGADTAVATAPDPSTVASAPSTSGTATTDSNGVPFDTSVVVAASRACLGGGCHEKSASLLDGYRRSRMTQATVKCNACHGTHTAAQVGQAKPNLTGYHPGMGATGYAVPKDRCVACHEKTLQRGGHPRNPETCTGCHAPHVFAADKSR